jgi:hypothetical protein
MEVDVRSGDLPRLLIFIPSFVKFVTQGRISRLVFFQCQRGLIDLERAVCRTYPGEGKVYHPVVS